MFRKQIAVTAGTIGLLVSAPPASAATWGEYGPADPNVVTCRAGRSGRHLAVHRAVPRDREVVGGYQYTSYYAILKQLDYVRRAWVAVSVSPVYFHRADWVVSDPRALRLLRSRLWLGTWHKSRSLVPDSNPWRLHGHVHVLVVGRENVNGRKGTNRVVGGTGPPSGRDLR